MPAKMIIKSENDMIKLLDDCILLTGIDVRDINVTVLFSDAVTEITKKNKLTNKQKKELKNE